MQRRFDTILRGLFPGEGTVLLAVSGGVDSMCMAELFRNSGRDFAIANCNFHLRGEESDGDSQMVEEWSRDHGIRFFRQDFDTEAYAAEKGLSIEMAARELRYAWFDSLCREHGFSALAVAHNSNDNAETLLLNMLRGSGIKGMTGMRKDGTVPVPGSTVRLVRPLLGFSRAEISDYVKANGVPFREDSTNSETEYKRNKLRHLAFPVFETINPSFLEALSRDMVNLSQVAEVADSYFEESRQKIVAFECPEEVRINRIALLADDNWKYLLYRLVEPYGFTSEDIASLGGVVNNGVSGKSFFSGDWRLMTSASEIIIQKNQNVNRDNQTGNSVRANARSAGTIVEGETSIVVEGLGIYEFGSRKFSVEVADRTPDLCLRQPDGVTMADAGTMNIPFLVRKWENGDWMVPLGLHGRKKLSDMFVDLKMSVPDKERALVAVVPGMNGGEDGPVRVAALLGKRIDESIKVTPETRKIVIVRILC